MNGTTPYDSRRLLPRWWAASQSAIHGELQFSRKLTQKKSKKTSIVNNSNILLDRLALKWRKEQNIENAAELVSTGVVVGINSDVENAAKYLICSSDIVAPEVIVASKFLLSGNANPLDVNVSEFRDIRNPTSIYRQISNLKFRVRTAPRDSISWIELARLYTVLGQNESARECIQVAITLSPENRFVLRSASRFFVHSNNVDEGLHIIRQSKSIVHDPWLQATEISLADIGDTSSKFLKFAIKNISMNTWEPRHCAELGGAAATMLYADGRYSQARKLMKLSIRDPNENALTQAEWASINGWAPSVSREKLMKFAAPEASALRNRHEMKWKQAVEACIEWRNMEPFSIRPLDYGAFISLVALEDGEKALTFLEQSVLKKPNDPTTLNNLAVAHAYIGDIEQADIQLNRINFKQLPERMQPVFNATKGLIAYRKGEIDKGRAFYFDAIQNANNLNKEPLKILAIWHLIREEAKIGTPELENLVTYVTDKFGHSSKLPEIMAMKERIKMNLNESQNQRLTRDLTPLQNTKEFKESGIKFH